MKKIELHLHFDGSIDVGYASWLMKRDVKDELVSKNDSSLNEYLKKFDLPIKLLQEPCTRFGRFAFSFFQRSNTQTQQRT